MTHHVHFKIEQQINNNGRKTDFKEDNPQREQTKTQTPTNEKKNKVIKNQLVIEEKSSTKNVVHVLRQETCHTSNFKNKFRQILWQVARTEASRDMYAHTFTHIHGTISRRLRTLSL